MDTKRLFELNSFRTNDHEVEQNFRETCSWYESKFSISDQTSSTAYQKYINNYNKAKSLYLIIENSNNKFYLCVFDTESERKNIKILKTPIGLSCDTCPTLLPNGELFCFWRSSNHDKAFIINSNYDFRLLPYGMHLLDSLAIYFNASVYCFGGKDKSWKSTAFSRRFDLNDNWWIGLASMPTADYICHSVIYNGNILMSGYVSGNLLLYSIGIDSFSTIPYNFHIGRKILINAERLYLIEHSGCIYESEAENEFAWNKISYHLSMQAIEPSQICCVYNKGEIYISLKGFNNCYFKFDLKQSRVTYF